MRHILLLFFFTVLTASASPMVLPAEWKFKAGDDASWSKPDLDDRNWKSMRTGAYWEDQGLADYDGYAWYRLRLKIPAAWKNEPTFKRHQGLVLELGRIDDVDETWFNGTSIGRTGQFPDDYQPAWDALRSYLVPAKLLRWDEENVIAVRVYDGSRGGGFYSGRQRLSVATWKDLATLEFELGKSDGTYRNLNEIPLEATLRNHSAAPMVGRATWTIKDDEGAILFQSPAGKLVSIPASHSFRLPFPAPHPGFFQVACRFQSEGQGAEITNSMTLGFEPEKISAPLTREDDFAQYWKETRTQLDKIAPEFALQRRPARDSKTHEVYEVTMRSFGNVRVAGWYEKPKAPGPHPALLRVPGYGSAMNPAGRPDPLAILSFNPRGHGNSQADVKHDPVNYWIRGLDDKAGYYYRGAYADCLRAVDFLATRSEIDQKRIAVTGGSQGGGLSLATAALDQRITLCAPDIPFLCDWQKYFKASHWPEMEKWIAADPIRSWQKTLRTMSYIDTLNLVDRIRCPVLFGIGLQDGVCPAATIFSVYNRIDAPKEYRLYPHASHRVPSSHREEKYRWIHKHFGTKSPE